MKIFKKQFFLLILVCAGLIAAFSYYKSNIFDACDEEEKYHAKSIDGKYIAKAIQKSCGATTANAMQVIVTGEQENDSSTTIFIADNVGEIEIEWLDNRNIKIKTSKSQDSKVYKNLSNLKDIKIEYELE